MRKRRFHTQRSGGFTLMELLLVVIIIGILASGLALSLSGRSEEARVTRAKSDIRGNLVVAVDLFEQDMGRYPTDSEGLNALMTNPGSSDRWKGPYLSTGLLPDPWGNAYVYKTEVNNGRRYKISSPGPDGTIDTEDDVHN